jgi:hypothetical protein
MQVLKLLLSKLPAVTAVFLPLHPLHGVEGLLILDVAQVLIALLLHQALITLGDGEPALLLVVAGTVLVG